jgi:glycopeptide antibiotics resistance protein
VPHFLLSLARVPALLFSLSTLYMFACLAIPVTIGTFRYYAGNRKPKTYWVKLAALLLYLALVFSFTGFATTWGLRTDHIANIDLNPISIFTHPASSLLNIIMMMPLGVLLPMLWPNFRSWRAVALVGFALSLTIEISQLFTVRAVTVDDVLMNTLGAIVGYAVYQAIANRHRAIPDQGLRAAAALSIPQSLGAVSLALATAGFFFFYHGGVSARANELGEAIGIPQIGNSGTVVVVGTGTQGQPGGASIAEGMESGFVTSIDGDILELNMLQVQVMADGTVVTGTNRDDEPQFLQVTPETQVTIIKANSQVVLSETAGQISDIQLGDRLDFLTETTDGEVPVATTIAIWRFLQ